MAKCITVGCHRPARTKGLCKFCYGRIYKMIRWGQTTWEALEKSGLEYRAQHSAQHYEILRQIETGERKMPFVKCMIEKCDRQAKTRGLCWPCYQAASRWVSEGHGTWEQLIEAGFAKPALRSSRRGNFANAVAGLNKIVNDYIDSGNGNEALMLGLPSEVIKKEQPDGFNQVSNTEIMLSTTTDNCSKKTSVEIPKPWASFIPDEEGEE